MNIYTKYLLEKHKLHTPKDEESGLPKKYVEGLNPTQKAKQIEEIKKSKEEYKRTGQIREREKVSDTHKRSPHVIKFEKMYGFPVTDLARVKKEFPDTDIETIIKKGKGAYASAGSRPNQSSYSWAFARLASVLTGGKAMVVDKSLIGENDLKKILANNK